MRHKKLHSVAHNYAASLAGGVSFVVPNRLLLSDIFAEAAANKEGVITADFLTGEVDGAIKNGEVEQALPLLKNAFPQFCEKHGVHASEYKAFLARFVLHRTEVSYFITIEDDNGKRSTVEYIGRAGKRAEELDHLGRRRPKLSSNPPQ
ncbi:hypothetical protein ATL17_1677 [Maritalea mobilis]|uniref:Uncharacterized protein n=1 Tax=Maritalea mobilis TaxID=483324 RepID=A0A4R6VNA4_9HYPH|nr:hypothetical protein [Maritalea mobilis]TDQ63670.1 hypothetical protein ATL17_1677 [Maritalea mobilis]